jgi:hypothetical protein
MLEAVAARARLDLQAAPSEQHQLRGRDGSSAGAREKARLLERALPAPQAVTREPRLGAGARV